MINFKKNHHGHSTFSVSGKWLSLKKGLENLPKDVHVNPEVKDEMFESAYNNNRQLPNKEDYNLVFIPHKLAMEKCQKMREYNFFDSKKKNPPSTPFQEYAINECGYKTPPASIIFSVIKLMTKKDFHQLGVQSISVNHKPILSTSYNLFNGSKELSQCLYIVSFFVSAQTFFGPNPQSGGVLCLGAIAYDNFSPVSGGLFLAN